MIASRPKLYFDACCFIDVVKHKVGLLPSSGNDDLWFIKKLLEAHRSGEVQICTSVLSIGECVSIERGQEEVPENIQQEFRDLLTSGQYVHLIQQTPRTPIITQNLRWKHKVVLGAVDALHVASAIEFGVKEFITSDRRLQGQKMAVAAEKLSAASLFMITASKTGNLPAHYLQGNMLTNA